MAAAAAAAGTLIGVVGERCDRTAAPNLLAGPTTSSPCPAAEFAAVIMAAAAAAAAMNWKSLLRVLTHSPSK